MMMNVILYCKIFFSQMIDNHNLNIQIGPCTAGGAYAPTMSEECIMVNRIGHVFLGGPPLVKAATGEVVSHEELGGAKLHTSVSGVADYFAKDEEESFAQVRDIVSGM